MDAPRRRPSGCMDAPPLRLQRPACVRPNHAYLPAPRVPPHLSTSPNAHARMARPLSSMNAATAAGLPPQIIEAFLQQRQTGSPGSDDGAACSTAGIANPAAASAPADAQGGRRVRRKQQRALPRWARHLLNAGLSLGLMAGSAAVGWNMYRHYVQQLDDRDQLATRLEAAEKRGRQLLSRWGVSPHGTPGCCGHCACAASQLVWSSQPAVCMACQFAQPPMGAQLPPPHPSVE